MQQITFRIDLAMLANRLIWKMTFFQQRDREQSQDIQNPCSMNDRELCHQRDYAYSVCRTHRSRVLHEQRNSACGSLIGAVCSGHVMRCFIGAHTRAKRNRTCLGTRAIAAPFCVGEVGGNANSAMMVFFLIPAVSYQIWRRRRSCGAALREHGINDSHRD